MSVNAIDGLVLLVVLFGVWRGFRIGFVRAL
ncbi:MAG: CvpA family protein, partial [Chloroflexi bacterium]|nr:CvpA family protein [Chloroflexota bacterium]